MCYNHVCPDCNLPQTSLQSCVLQQHCKEITIVLRITHDSLRHFPPSICNSPRFRIVFYCPFDLGHKIREIRKDRDVVFIRPDPRVEILSKRSGLRCMQLGHKKQVSRVGKQKPLTLKTNDPLLKSPKYRPLNVFPSTSNKYLDRYSLSLASDIPKTSYSRHIRTLSQ